jgi:hypothetical protein
MYKGGQWPADGCTVQVILSSLDLLAHSQTSIMGHAARAWKWSALAGLLSALASAAEPTVSVLNGTYEGRYLPGFDQDLFLGIPYAQDTGGLHRFLVPQSLYATWNGTRPAKQYGNACPDPEPERDGEFGMSEDCAAGWTLTRRI